jgi:hypothetical protein
VRAPLIKVMYRTKHTLSNGAFYRMVRIMRVAWLMKTLFQGKRNVRYSIINTGKQNFDHFPSCFQMLIAFSVFHQPRNTHCPHRREKNTVGKRASSSISSFNWKCAHILRGKLWPVEVLNWLVFSLCAPHTKKSGE